MDRYSHPKYFSYSQRPRPHRQITTCMFLNQRSASFIRRSVCRYIFNVAVDAAWDAEEALLHRRRLITRPYKLNEKATLHSPIALIDLENICTASLLLFIYLHQFYPTCTMEQQLISSRVRVEAHHRRERTYLIYTGGGGATFGLSSVFLPVRSYFLNAM